MTASCVRRGERPLLLLATTLPLAAIFIPDTVYRSPLLVATSADAARLAALNVGSVAALLFLLALQLAELLRRPNPPTD